MARRGKISEVYDLAAIETQQAKVVAMVNDLVSKISDIKPVVIKLEGTEKTKEVLDGIKVLGDATTKVSESSKIAVTELGKMVDMAGKSAGANAKLAKSYEDIILASTKNKIASDALKKAADEVKYAYSKGLITLDGYTESLAKIKKKQNEISVSNLELNRSLRNIEKGFQAAGTSTNAMRAELNLALQALDRLTAAEKDSDIGVELKKQIDELTASITKEEQATGRFQRNVGNYASGFTGAFKTLNDELSKVQSKISSGSFSGEALTQLRKEEQLLTEVTEGLTKSFSSTTAESRAYQQAAAKLGISIGQDSEAFKAFRAEVGKGVDDIKDVKDSIKLASSDTQGFDRLINAAQGLTGAYAVLSGGVEAFGGSSEEAAEAQKKLVAVMTILQGLQAVQNELTNKDSLFRKAAIALQKVWNRTMVEGAVASNALKIGLTGGLLLLLPLLAYAFNKTADKIDDFKAKQQALRDVNLKAAESVTQVKIQISDLKTKFELAKAGVISKKDALKEYNEGLGKTLGATNSLNVAEQRLLENAPKLIEYTFLKAKAQAAGELAAEEAKKGLIAANKNVEEFLGLGDKVKIGVKSFIRSMFGNDMTENMKDIATAGLKGQKKAVDEAEAGANRYLNLQQQFTKEAAVFASKNKLNFFENSEVKEVDNSQAIKNAAETRKILQEIKQQQIQDAISAADLYAQTETNSFNSRLEAEQVYYEQKKQLLESQKAFDLKEIDEREKAAKAKDRKTPEQVNAEKLALQTKYNSDILALNTESEGRITNLVSTNEQARKQIQAQFQSDRIAGIQNELDDKVTAIEKAALKEQETALDQFSKGIINKDQYEKRLLQIENDTREQSLRAEIDYYQKLITLSKLPQDQKEAALKKLSELEDELDKERLKKKKEKTLEELAIEKEKNEKLKDLANEVKETVFAFLTAGIDKQKNKVQEQIDQIDVKKAKEIEAVNQSVLNEQDKAAKIAIIEARAAAEKERLEQRKRKLDQEKARYERLKNIADIIQSTAIAVVSTLGAKPWTPANIALATVVGAIGAAQIARVLATPLPKYKDGTQDHQGGHAVVGDGGVPEFVQTPDGNVYKTPATDTIVDLPAHSKVFKNEKSFLDAMMKRHVNATMRIENMRPNDHYQFQNMTSTLGNKLDAVKDAIKKIPQTKIITEGPLRRWMGSNDSWDKFKG